MVNTKTKKLVTLSLLSAMAFVLSLIKIPIIPATPFLTLDFSDIPIFFGMYVFGPAGGTIIAFVRSVLQYVSTGGEAGFPIGPTASFIASLSMTLPLYYIVTSKKMNVKNKIMATLASSVSLTIVLSLVNYFFVLPAYLLVMGFEVGSVRDYILFALVPFNMIKGVLLSSVIFIMLPRMKLWLDKIKSEMGREKSTKYHLEK